jgi:long-subunit fatty acid transport protein
MPIVTITRLRVTTFGLLLASATVAAQGPTTLEFSFSNPGARSMGLAGAFIGLADDATAAFANPAGLVQLVSPEVSLEVRHWAYETPFVVGGRASGMPTGIGIDTTADLRYGVSSDSLTGVSFLSFVYPVKRWSLAFYGHQLARFKASAATNGLFASPAPGAIDRLDDVLNSLDLDVQSFGASAAYKVSDAFSFGFGVSYARGDVLYRQHQFQTDNSSLRTFFAPASYSPEQLIGTTDIIVDDTDLTVLAGFLWRISRRVSLGGVYRQGPAFDADVVLTAGPVFDPGVPAGSVIRDETPFELPDVFGLGVAARSKGDALTFSFDWARVEYSTFLEGLNREVFDDLPIVDDADEFHAGLEYVFMKTKPIVALRFGVWHDPDHRFRAASDEAEPFDQALFQDGEDQTHLTGGLGLVFRKFQLDLGIDVSDLVDTASISGIYKF